jgi:hypothetical protein
MPCAVVAFVAVLDLAFGDHLIRFFEWHLDGELVPFQVVLLRVGGFSFLMSVLLFVSLYHLFYFAFGNWALRQWPEK